MVNNNSTTNTPHLQRSSNSNSTAKLPTAVTSTIFKSEDIQEKMLLINEALQDFLKTLTGEPKILYEAARHLILAGGKRLRSLVTLLCCEAVGGSVKKVLPITVAAELLQTASLIHDDIVDKDDLRRGVQTVHKKFGLDIAILAGDLLIAQAFKLIGEHGSPELIANVGASGIRMCEGEVIDLFITPENEESFTKEQYLNMVERKTVAFLEEAARTGAIVGEATPEQCKALTKYGAMIGYAFQLRDDILDIKATRQIVQKTTLSDLRLKRGNYPLIFALEACSDDKRNECLEALNSRQWKRVLDIISETNAIQQTSKLAQSYSKRAKRALQGNNFVNKHVLEQLADFTLQREF